MGSPQGTTLHTDSDNKKTSAVWADDGTGTSRWLLWARNALLESAIKVVDAAAGAADRGLNVLAVRRDAATGEGASGDYVRLTVDALSRLRVTGPVVEDAASASGDPVFPMGAVRRDTSAAGSGSDGDYEVLQTDAVGRLRAVTPVIRNGGTGVTSSSGNVANATATATLAAPGAGITNYLTGFEITAAGATAAAVVLVTVTGTIGGTMTFVFAVPAGATAPATPLIVAFPEPIPASAANVAIVVSLPALGAGNTNAAVVAHGFTR